MFTYIEENLEKIKNPADVDIIKPAKHNKGWELWARINNGKAIQLTQPMGVMTFPFEPIFWLARERFGRFYFEDFGTIDNQISINKKHLIRLGYVDTNKKIIETYAYFDDGQVITLYHPLRKYFYKEFKPMMEQKFEMLFEDVTEEVKQENRLNQ